MAVEEEVLRRRYVHSIERWIHDAIRSNRGRPHRDREGKPVPMPGVVVHETERDAVLEALRASQEPYRALVETTSGWIWETDAEIRFTYSNRNVRDVLGYEPEELIGRMPLDLVVPEERDAGAGKLAAMASTLLPVSGFEATCLGKDGRRVVLEISGVPVLDAKGAFSGVRGIARGVIERNRAEEIVRRSEERYRSLVSNIPDVVWTLDDGLRFVFVSPNIEKISGFSLEEIQRQGARLYLDCIHPDDVDRVRTALQALFATGEPYDVECRTARKDGEWIWVRDRALSTYEKDGGRYADGLLSDITARKRAEMALERSEAELKEALRAAQMGVWTWTQATGAITWDENFYRITGRDPKLPPPDLRELAQFYAPESWKRMVCTLEDIFATGTPYELDLEVVRPDGSRRWTVAHGQAVRDDNGHIVGLRGTVQDITGRKLAEAEMAERNRLATLNAETGVALARAETLGQGLQQCAQAIVHYVDAAFARFWTLNECEKVLELQASAGMYTHLDGAHGRVPLGRFKIGRIAENGEPHLTNRVTEDSWLSDPEWARREGIVAFAGYPLMVEGRVLGVMGAFARHPLSTAVLQAFASVADTIAQFIQRKRAEEMLVERESILRAITDSAQDAIVMMDPQGCVSFWNQAAERILFYKRDEVLGRNLHELLVSGSYLDAHRVKFPEFQRSGFGDAVGKTLELRALRKDGREIDVALSLSAVQIKGEWNSVGIMRDITAQKHTEGDLNRARKAAEAASHAKSEFLANMSHEIRTPMNGILGMTELALDTDLAPAQRGYLEVVKSCGESLLTVINDILDFSKVEAGKLEFESVEFNLRDSLEPVMKALGVRACERCLDLNYSVAPEVPEALVGDAGRLSQVLNNLVGNAIKFTERGEVFVEVTRESESDGQVCLHFGVRDTGIGIPVEKQARIFESFTQADTSTTRCYGGTGLGLTISRRLVEMMGGRIRVESVPGTGSTFHFTAVFGIGSAPSHPELQHLDLSGMPVLVVDDKVTSRRILEAQLTAWHMRPRLAADARTALDLLTQAADAGHPFPLAVVDAQMPETDGFALIAEIQRNPGLAGTAILVLTSATRKGETAYCRDLHVAAHLIKPVGRSELRKAIAQAMGNERLAPPPSQPPADRFPGLHILLAEDNPVNRILAVRLLEKCGHTVVTATNGRDALQEVERGSFDLVLTDVQMPEMDGFEATAALRQKEKATGSHLPVIAMTAYAMNGDRERCLAAGMDGYVAKPLKAADLFGTIERVLAEAGSRNALLPRS